MQVNFDAQVTNGPISVTVLPANPPTVTTTPPAARFGHHTLRDDEVLQEFNARIVAAGRRMFAKRGAALLAELAVKVDMCVLETDVHYPTDLNLLWEAVRKCTKLIEKYREQLGHVLPG